MLEEDNLFARALSQVSIDEDIEHLQVEFAGLCNQIIAADQRPIPDRNALKEVVKKASGALKLKWRADKWLANCWFAGQGLSLTFWGEAWLGVLGGLLIKRPLFFDNYRSGKIYREFFSRTDITETETILNDIVAFDDLLSLMSINLAPLSSYEFLTFKNLILTLWARHVCGLSEDPEPVQRFFRSTRPNCNEAKKNIASYERIVFKLAVCQVYSERLRNCGKIRPCIGEPFHGDRKRVWNGIHRGP
jgi:hypothetical protein